MSGICGGYENVEMLVDRLDAHYGKGAWRIVGRDLETLQTGGRWESYYRVAQYRDGRWQIYDETKVG